MPQIWLGKLNLVEAQLIDNTTPSNRPNVLKSCLGGTEPNLEASKPWPHTSKQRPVPKFVLVVVAYHLTSYSISHIVFLSRVEESSLTCPACPELSILPKIKN